MRLLIFVLLFLRSSFAVCEDFYIEDPALSVIPQAIEDVVRSQEHTPDATSCRLVGKTLDVGGAEMAYAVTTAEACGWGSAKGPIWIVLKSSDPARVLLSSGGYSLTVGTQSTNGLRQIAISAGTAGWYEESIWKYDGSAYNQVRSYTFRPDDRATCEAHPKICPWAFSGESMP
jgi:hypothetical protein